MADREDGLMRLAQAVLAVEDDGNIVTVTGYIMLAAPSDEDDPDYDDDYDDERGCADAT